MERTQPNPRILIAISLASIAWALGCASRQVGTTAGAAPGKTATSIRYTNTEIDYFLEVALGVEFAHGDKPRFTKRWPTEKLPAARLRIEGDPTAHDLAVLGSITAEINDIVGMPLVAIEPERANVIVRFVPRDRMRSYSSLVPRWGAGGFVVVELSKDFVIQRGQVLIASDIPFRARKPIIREEVTQLLGLLNDSDWYPESIFNDANFANHYSRLDRALIEMLYHPEMKPGLDERQTRKVLNRIAR